MRRILTLAAIATGAFAQQNSIPAELKDRPILERENRVMLGDGTVRETAPLDPLSKAQAEFDRLHKLVEEGVLPRAALDKAEQELVDAKDDAILRQTLYGNLGVEDLTADQSEVMIAAAQRQFERQQAKLESARKLVDAGVAARTTLTPFLEELDARRRTLDLANSRARLLTELAELAKAEEEIEMPVEPQGPIRLAERFDGDGGFTEADFQRIADAFEKKFSRPLPISAKGSTAVHRSMGFDHRGRVDVALNPDQLHGAWLIQTLRSERIPYFAFRAAIPGKATGAHIHMGPPSTRYRAAD